MQLLCNILLKGDNKKLIEYITEEEFSILKRFGTISGEGRVTIQKIDFTNFIIDDKAKTITIEKKIKEWSYTPTKEEIIRYLLTEEEIIQEQIIFADMNDYEIRTQYSRN